jgi:hypothetical protein
MPNREGYDRADAAEQCEGPLWGHEGWFPLPRLGARYRFVEETFAETSANGRDAPKTVVT